MLVKDSEAIEKAKKQAELEAYRERVDNWARLEAANCQFLLDERTDCTNIPSRLGSPMTHEALERQIKRIVPRMQFLYGPLSEIKGTKKMVLPDENGVEIWSCVYNTGLLPERSIRARVTKEVMDIGGPKFSRKDLPKYEFVPGEGYKWDASVAAPGFKRVELPSHEIRRGWRTVLLMMIVGGVASLEAVERVFRADNTPSWQQHTGRKNHGIPW